MPFYVFAWIAEFLYAFGSIVGKLSSKHQVTNPWLFNFLWTILTILITIPFAIAGHIQWPTHWVTLAILGFLGALSGTLYILSLYALDVSILGPIYNMRTAIAVALGIIFFHERLVGYQIGLIVVMILAGLFVTIDEKHGVKSFLQKSVLLGFVTIVCSAIYNSFLKYSMQVEGYWEVTLWSLVLTQVFLLPTIPLFWKDMKKMRLGDLGGVTGSTVFLAFGMFAANKAYAANVGISAAIMSVPLSMIIAFLFSIFAPKLLEKHTMKIYAIRFTAAAVMILAALKLTL